MWREGYNKQIYNLQFVSYIVDPVEGIENEYVELLRKVVREGPSAKMH